MTLHEIVESVREECMGHHGTGSNEPLHLLNLNVKNDDVASVLGMCDPFRNFLGNKPYGIDKLLARVKLYLTPTGWGLAPGLRRYLLDPLPYCPEAVHLFHYQLKNIPEEGSLVHKMESPTCMQILGMTQTNIVGPVSCMRQAVDYLKDHPDNIFGFLEAAFDIPGRLDNVKKRIEIIYIHDSCKRPKEIGYHKE